MLGIKSIRQTVAKLPDIYKIKNCVDKIDAWFVTEFGLYKLIMISRKPIAEEFESWVFNLIKEHKYSQSIFFQDYKLDIYINDHLNFSQSQKKYN